VTWRDFTGTKPASGDTIVAASINTELDWGTSEEFFPGADDTMTGFNAFVRFNPENSYTTTKDPYVLKHEQGHLDIDLIVCNRANKVAALNLRYSVPQWNDIQNYFIKMWNDLDIQYDKETNHSINHSEQERWNIWIKEQLKSK
jgi:hypothetical protein